MILILITILIVNMIWGTLWFLRKTETLEYKVNRFIKKEKVKPKVGRDHMLLSSDALIQIFLRSGNEDLRESLRSDFARDNLLSLLEKYLKKSDNMLYINSEAKFITRKAPVAPPLPKDSDYIIL